MRVAFVPFLLAPFSLIFMLWSFVLIAFLEHEISQNLERGRGNLDTAVDFVGSKNRNESFLSEVMRTYLKKPRNAIFVVSLQGTPGSDERNDDRFENFQGAITDLCKDKTPQIIHCPGINANRRGYGLTTAHMICFRKAIEMDQEVSLFFEDDARPFLVERENFCDLVSASAKHFSKYSAEDSLLTFLGGHNWHTKEINNRSNVVESSLSFGTYAFAVPRRNVRHLLLSAEDDLVNGFRDESNVHLHSNFLSPEKSWYRLAHNLGLKIHVTQPLLVWHEEGYSNTWKTKRHAIVGRENQIETKNEIIVTGELANCTRDSTDEKSEMAQSEPLLGKERVTVSCRSLAYKLPVQQLREVKTIPIIVGVLSHAKNVQRRQVSCISDFKIIDLSKVISFLNVSPLTTPPQPQCFLLDYSRNMGKE